MKKIAAGEFKARCLTLMEDVRSTREPLIITKRGMARPDGVPTDVDREIIAGFLEVDEAKFREMVKAS